MQFQDFRRIVTTFADQENEMVVDEGNLLMFIRGKPVEAEIKNDPQHGVIVIHNGVEGYARSWIFSYLAKIDMLAQRIIDYIHPPENYVSPNVNLLDWKNEPVKTDQSIDSIAHLRKRLTNFHAGMTLINFLTSDAGEGKTSLIEKNSIEQALAFKNKKTSTLILPVALGGRSFLRFDDVVIASLMNRLRFPYLYYDSFIELIKMNAIIPAFDGFEEVLVDVSSTEAVSALGHLVDQLSSSGTLLIAARKAYFDQSLNSQAKLLESIGSDHDVKIQRFVLNRWDRQVFSKYASLRGVPSPNQLYERVKKRLNNTKHPVLTRAVLVRRLIDVANEDDDLEKFLKKLGQTQVDYFFEFIEVIVKREAQEKWIDRSGIDQSPLLTIDQHHKLLSQIASEMWVNAVDALRFDIIELVIEFFTAENNLSSNVERQICRRITDHSLLREDKSQGPTRQSRIRFDHEDFQEFYLGQALGRSLIQVEMSDARLILNAHALSKSVILEASRFLTTHQHIITIDDVLTNLEHLSKERPRVSYFRENCGTLMLELLPHANQPHHILETNFPPNSLLLRSLRGLSVHHSLFSSTSLDDSEFIDCQFHDCRFTELIFEDDPKITFESTVFDNCTFDSVSVGNGSEGDHQKIFNPTYVHAVLKNLGIDIRFKTPQNEVLDSPQPFPMDSDMKTTLRFIRMFNRSTTINQNDISLRLGNQYGRFLNQILPKLEKIHLVESADHSNPNKYRLRLSPSEIDKLVDQSGSTFQRFIEEASNLQSLTS